jgi:hypothetical protein
MNSCGERFPSALCGGTSLTVVSFPLLLDRDVDCDGDDHQRAGADRQGDTPVRRSGHPGEDAFHLRLRECAESLRACKAKRAET